MKKIILIISILSLCLCGSDNVLDTPVDYNNEKINAIVIADIFDDKNDSDDAVAWCNKVRVGAVCNDGWISSSTGSGTCSWHGGVNYWLYECR